MIVLTNNVRPWLSRIDILLKERIGIILLIGISNNLDDLIR